MTTQTENTKSATTSTTSTTSTTEKKVAKICYAALISAIALLKKIADKNALIKMTTEKFYKTKIVNKRAKKIERIAQMLLNESQTEAFIDDESADAAIHLRLCEEAQQVYITALHIQHHIDYVDSASERISALKAKHAKSAALIAKLEARSK
jgi:hypothetical protein